MVVKNCLLSNKTLLFCHKFVNIDKIVKVCYNTMLIMAVISKKASGGAPNRVGDFWGSTPLIAINLEELVHNGLFSY